MGLTRDAWRNRAVRRVVGAFAAVTIAEWILGTSVAIHAYPVGGALLVGLVGFRFAPGAIAGLFTAQLADAHRRERILTAVALARAAASGGVAVSLALKLPIGIAVGLVWVDAIAGSAYRPAQAALLPCVVSTPGGLTAATAMASNAKSSSQVLGALAGGLLVAGLSVSVTVSVATALYLAAAVMTSAIPPPGRPAGSSPDSVRARVRALRDGAAALGVNREAAGIVGLACMRALVRGLWMALGVVTAARLLGLGTAGFGYLMAAAGIGALIAIRVTAMLVGRRKLAPWFAGSLLFVGLPIALVGANGHGDTVAIALMVGWGIGMSLSDVAGQALLNRVVPAAGIGQVTGLLESGKLLAEGAGSVLAPLLLTLVGLRATLVSTGVLIPLLVPLTRRALNRIDARAASRAGVLELVSRIPFFKPLQLDQLEAVVAQLRPVLAPAGTDVVVEGERDDRGWYIVESGTLEVLAGGYLINELVAGDSFGELSLLRNTPRSATVRARDSVRLLTLDRQAFIEAVTGYSAEVVAPQIPQSGASSDPAALLELAPLLRGLGRWRLRELAARSATLEFSAGEAIVTVGEVDDRYHVLLAGRAQVIVGGEPRREFFPGEGFGEIAVLHRVPRAATVVALEDCRVLTIAGDELRAIAEGRGGALGELARSAAAG